MPDIRFVSHLVDVVSSYRAVLCDVWGVLHNGEQAYPAAVAALLAVKKAGLPVVLLTNAPRPAREVAEQLRQFCVPDEAYDAVVSSGEVAKNLLTSRGRSRFFHLGPARDRSIFASWEGKASALETADFVLCTGLFDDETETAEDYRPLLEKVLGLQLTFYCVNPDLLVERGGRIIPCAGALAALYEKMGGEVVWVGKPHALVYETGQKVIENLLGQTCSMAQILCIGDALRTDIAGAARMGAASLMVLDGIHAHDYCAAGEPLNAEVLAVFFSKNGVFPDMVMRHLA